MKHALFAIAALIAFPLCADAQPNGPLNNKKKGSPRDSVAVVTEHETDRQMMSNASAMDQPRDLDTGLGSSATPTSIFEDGLPVSYNSFPIRANQHWKPGSPLEKQRMLGLAESAVRAGEACYIMDSYALKGANKFEGQANIRFNNWHHQTYDGSLAIPIAKGWSTAVSFLQDYNEGYTKIRITPMQARQQMFQWGITKEFAKGKFWAYYKYTDDFQNSDENAPAYYHIDGSMELAEGFKIGRDTYQPSDDKVVYMDVKTGSMDSVNFGKLGQAYINELQAGLEYDFRDDLKFKGVVKWLHATTDKLLNNIMGQGVANANSGFTYADGSLFTGNYQTRNIKREQSTNTDITATFELIKKTDDYEWTIGFNQWHDELDFQGSSAIIGQEQKTNPDRIYLRGQNSWSYNLQSEYTYGNENRAALYWIHKFNITPAWNVRYGFRLEDKYLNVFAPFNNEGEKVNNRTGNFSMKREGAYINHRHYNWIIPTVTGYTSYLINRHWLASVDFTYIRGRKRLHDFGNANLPDLTPSETILGTAGISYRNSFMDWASKVSLMRMNSQLSNTSFSKTFGDYAASAQTQTYYDQQAISWINDVNVHPFKGFNLHVRLALQNPEYKSYKCDITYDNGISESYDFSGKTIKSISRVQLEIDPSYAFGPLRLSATARYFGPSYVNITNTLDFNSRWETFANIDYRLNKHVSFNLNIINPINQTGISGRVKGGDTADAEQAKAFDNQLVAASYMIPRTFNFTTRIRF